MAAKGCVGGLGGGTLGDTIGSVQEVSLGGSHELVHAAVGVPVLDIEVPLVVEAHAVGSGGDAGLPGFLGDAVVGPVRLDGIVAEVAEHGVVAVEQGDPAFEFGNGDQPRAIGSRPECNAARAAEIGDRRVDVRAVQAQALQASVLAVADD